MPKELTTDILIYHLVDRVLRLSDRTFKAITEVLRELDLSEPLANLLWHLDPDAPSPTMSDVAGMMYCDPSTVTFLVGRLEARGLVVRRASEHDRRAKVVVLTEHGQTVRKRLVNVVTTQTPLGTLSMSEREQLLRLLSKAVPNEAQPTLPECFE